MLVSSLEMCKSREVLYRWERQRQYYQRRVDSFAYSKNPCNIQVKMNISRHFSISVEKARDTFVVGK